MEKQLLVLSKNQIRKLGNTIRQESSVNSISQDSLLNLQEFRVSYKDSLSIVFKVLADESKKVRSSRVVTYRIKRIESIISKLKRYPNMELGKMVDVAGCRCIVDSVKDIITIKQALLKKLFVFDERDYLNLNESDGYMALHLFVRSNEDDKKSIEIQLRTKSQHNWATFVEILDVIYDTKVKEGQNIPDLKRFCYLLADTNTLGLKESLELLNIEKERKIYSKLSEVFVQNYIITRKTWLSIEEKKNHNFFIIEVDKEKRTHIESFEDFEVAEEVYLSKFNNDKTNIVLTRLEAPSYKLISIAYSNYILSMHKFQEDICEIAKSTIESLINNNKIKAKEISELYLQYIQQESASIQLEFDELKKSIPENDPKSKKLEEWLDDVSDRLTKRNSILVESNAKITISFEEILILNLKQLLKRFFISKKK